MSVSVDTMPPDSPQAAPRPPHPLALALIEHARESRIARVFEIGSGSGRNTRALRAAGLTVDIDIPHGVYRAALSTHALLHGTPDDIAARLASIADALDNDGVAFVTFGSKADARYGHGMPIATDCYAPVEGDETGVAHTYFDDASLRTLLASRWTIDTIEERCVDDIAGSWAHASTPLRGAMHWFAMLRKH